MPDNVLVATFAPLGSQHERVYTQAPGLQVVLRMKLAAVNAVGCSFMMPRGSRLASVRALLSSCCRPSGAQRQKPMASKSRITVVCQ